ncbi:hypothetical protein [Clostridium thailandense]
MTINGVYLSYNEMFKITETLESFFKTQMGKRILEKSKGIKEAKVMK